VALKVLDKEFEIFKGRRTHAVIGFELTKNWVNQNSEFISWIEPKAGALCFIKLIDKQFTKDNIEKFYSSSKEAGIQISNGEWFGESKRYFRLGFGYMDIKKLDFTLKKLGGILTETATKKQTKNEI